MTAERLPRNRGGAVRKFLNAKNVAERGRMFSLPDMSTHQRLSRARIDRLAQRVALHFDPIAMQRKGSPLDAVEEGLRRAGLPMVFNKTLGVGPHGKKILGQFVVEPQQIWIDKSLHRDSHVFRWALAHEIGHLFLHDQIDPQFVSREGRAFIDTRYQLRFIRSAHWSAAEWIEWQANQFASSLLLPIPVLTTALVEIQTELEIPKAGLIYLDDQPCNLRDYAKVMPKLVERFNISRKILYIRLKTIGELIEARRAAKDHVQDTLRSFFLEKTSGGYTRLAA